MIKEMIPLPASPSWAGKVLTFMRWNDWEVYHVNAKRFITAFMRLLGDLFGKGMGIVWLDLKEVLTQLPLI